MVWLNLSFLRSNKPPVILPPCANASLSGDFVFRLNADFRPRARGYQSDNCQCNPSVHVKPPVNSFGDRRYCVRFDLSHPLIRVFNISFGHFTPILKKSNSVGLPLKHSIHQQTELSSVLSIRCLSGHNSSKIAIALDMLNGAEQVRNPHLSCNPTLQASACRATHKALCAVPASRRMRAALLNCWGSCTPLAYFFCC